MFEEKRKTVSLQEFLEETVMLDDGHASMTAEHYEILLGYARFKNELTLGGE